MRTTSYSRSVVSLAIGLSVAVLLTGSLGCSETDFEAVAERRSRLLGNLESYMNQEEARNALNVESEWTVLKESGLEEGDRRPRFDMLVISVGPFEHHGYSGELLLKFFNDRLMSTIFHPEKPSDYLLTLRKSGIATGDFDKVLVPPATVIVTATDWQNREYILWGDKRLYDQHIKWINTYS